MLGYEILPGCRTMLGYGPAARHRTNNLKVQTMIITDPTANLPADAI